MNGVLLTIGKWCNNSISALGTYVDIIIGVRVVSLFRIS